MKMGSRVGIGPSPPPLRDANSIFPVPLLTDQLNAILLLILFMIGAPTNILAFFQLRKERARLRLLPRIRSRWDMECLKAHLNVADILILFFYALTEIIWLVTYRWYAGDIMCKTMMFLRAFAFQLLSNLMVCVALNRLLILKRPEADTCLKWTILIAWLSALLLSSPQFVVWGVGSPIPLHPEWQQCVDIWALRNANLSSVSPPFSFSFYNSFHIMAIFWIPFTLVAGIYLYICISLRSLQLTVAASHSLRVASAFLLAFTLCWLPFNVLQLLKIAMGYQWYMDWMMEAHALHSLVVLTSVINPYLYQFFRLQQRDEEFSAHEHSALGFL